MAMVILLTACDEWAPLPTPRPSRTLAIVSRAPTAPPTFTIAPTDPPTRSPVRPAPAGEPAVTVSGTDPPTRSPARPVPTPVPTTTIPPTDPPTRSPFRPPPPTPDPSSAHGRVYPLTYQWKAGAQMTVVFTGFPLGATIARAPTCDAYPVCPLVVTADPQWVSATVPTAPGQYVDHWLVNNVPYEFTVTVYP